MPRKDDRIKLTPAQQTLLSELVAGKELHRTQTTNMFDLYGTYAVRVNRTTVQRLLDLNMIEKGRLPIASNTRQHYPLTDWGRAFHQTTPKETQA